MSLSTVTKVVTKHESSRYWLLRFVFLPAHGYTYYRLTTRPRMPTQYRCTSVILNIRLFNLPVISNFITESTFHVAVQQIIANICSGSFHPFNMNWSLRDIEIIREELGWRCWSFPMKLFGDVSPEFLRSIDRTFVHISVLIHGANVGFP